MLTESPGRVFCPPTPMTSRPDIRPWIRTDRAWPRPLLASPTLLHVLEEWAAHWYPLEACGLLVGRREEAADRVVRFERTQNREQERGWDRYTLAPEDWVRIEVQAREESLDVVGVWHSHPDHAALPSESDLAFAWEGYSYLITRAGAGASAHRAWRLDGGIFVEQELR